METDQSGSERTDKSDISRDLPEVDDIDDGAKEGELEKIPWLVQGVWILFGFGGFLRSLYQPKSAFPWHPDASALSLAWLAFTIIGLVVNSLDQVGLPGAKLSFRKRLFRAEAAANKRQTSVEALEEALDDYCDLMQMWLHSVNLLPEHLDRYSNDLASANEIIARFCLERMEEAKEIIGEAGDRLRFSYWGFVEEVGGLTLIFSDDIRDEATNSHVFRPGSGLLGQCYIEARQYNLPDAPSSIYYEKIRESPKYRGILMVPVRARTNGDVMGVLSIDRVKRETFPGTAVDVATALSDLIAYALEALGSKSAELAPE